MGALDRILEKCSPSYAQKDASIPIEAEGIGEIGAAIIQKYILEQRLREDNEIIAKVSPLVL